MLRSSIILYKTSKMIYMKKNNEFFLIELAKNVFISFLQLPINLSNCANNTVNHTFIQEL